MTATVARNTRLPPNWRSAMPLVALVGCMLAFAAYAVLRGQVSSWDLRNYHWYDAWAWWTQRDGDFAVAQVQTWFNPLLHVPFWLLATHAPPRLAVFVLALVQGTNLLLAYAIARRVLPEGARWQWPAVATAVTGALGSTHVLELGATMGDNLVSIGMLGTLCLLLRATRQRTRGVLLCAAAGLLAGATMGLKLTCAPLVAGCAAATLFAADDARGRVKVVLAFAAASMAGLLLTSGWWFLHLWREFGNPLHPYFAGHFATEWQPPFPSGDARFIVHGPLDAVSRLLAPVYDWRSTGEFRFRDLRLPLLALATACWPWLRRGVQSPARTALDALLLAFAVSWIAWVAMFGYYRYIAAWEWLAPACVAAVVAHRMPGRVAALAICVLLVVTTNPSELPRVHFQSQFLTTELPPIARRGSETIVLAGDAPIGYLATALGAQRRYLRVSGNFSGPPEAPWRADRELAARLDAETGPLLLLHGEADATALEPALARFGLALADGTCEPVRSSWTPDDDSVPMLCALQRNGDAESALARASAATP